MSVLGCIVLDAERSFKVLKEHGVGRMHFYDLRYRDIYRVLEAMHRRGEDVNTMTVYQRAKEAGLAETPEQTLMVTGLVDCVPSAYSLESFLPEMIDKHRRRLVLDISERLAKLASDPDVPPLPLLEDANEAVRTLRRMCSSERITLRSAQDLLDQTLPQDDNILADRLLAQGQSLTLLGAGGLGKSRLLLQLAASCIAGRPFIGLRTHAPDLKWMILQAENSNRRLQDDLRALRAWLGADWERVAQRLMIHTLEAGHDCFVQLQSSGAMSKLEDAIREHDPDVVCFDPLNCFTSGDLNNDSEMRTVCQGITALCQGTRADRATVVLHHALTGRAGAARATGFDRSSFGRNSKLLHAWTRGQINLAPVEGGNNQRLVVSCGKCSNGEEFEAFAVRLDPQSMIYQVDPEFDLSGWERTVLNMERADPVDVLLDVCKGGLRRAEAVKRMVERGQSRATAYRAVEEALRQGWVRCEGESVLLAVEEPGEAGA